VVSEGTFRGDGVLLWNIKSNYAVLVSRKEMECMKCANKNDLMVDYSPGTLPVTKGDGVDHVVAGGHYLPTTRHALMRRLTATVVTN
jgi:hypothetical protein